MAVTERNEVMPSGPERSATRGRRSVLLRNRTVSMYPTASTKMSGPGTADQSPVEIETTQSIAAVTPMNTAIPKVTRENQRMTRSIRADPYLHSGEGQRRDCG